MSINFDPAKPPGDDNEWPSSEEFEKWLKADPKNFEAWSKMVERAAQDESAAPELRDLALKAVAKRRQAQSLKAVQDKFKAFGEIMQRPGGTMLAEERLAQCNAIMDEITDALLETPEPHRTRFLKELLPLREQLRAVKLED